jgi:O-antigen ligase
MLLVLPLAAYYVKLKASRWQRWFCALSVLIMLVAFTLASSRGGLVGLCAVIAYMILRSGQSRRGAFVIALLLLPMLIFSPASPLQRMLHPNYGDYVGAQVRREFWSAGLEMISNHPLTGIGLGNFTAHSVSKEVEGFQGIACNTFLEVAAELGVPGFLAYCAVVAGALVSAGKLRTAGKDTGNAFLQYTGQAMQAGLLGFAVAAFFVSAEYQKPFWIMVALTATVPTLLRDHNAGFRNAEEIPAALATSFSTLEEQVAERYRWADPVHVSPAGTGE